MHKVYQSEHLRVGLVNMTPYQVLSCGTTKEHRRRVVESLFQSFQVIAVTEINQ